MGPEGAAEADLLEWWTELQTEWKAGTDSVDQGVDLLEVHSGKAEVVLPLSEVEDNAAPWAEPDWGGKNSQKVWVADLDHVHCREERYSP